ncbi:MAG: DNA polymerase III subunit alpha [Brevinematales bacterium]|nr:DNA polymerase III subunit alpha [Brevinematales bacterium]
MLANLHTHSEYSFLSSLLGVDRIVGLSAYYGYKAVGLSDTVSTFGFFKLTRFCESENLKPLYGVELFIKTPEKNIFPVIFYAKNNEGLKNIFKLTSYSQKNFYEIGKYALPFETIEENSNNLIVLVEEEIFYYKDDFATLKKVINRYKKIFKENFYTEVNYTGAKKVSMLKELVELINNFELRALPTCETRYHKEDKVAFDFLNSMREKSFSRNEKGKFFIGSEYDYSFKTKEEFEKIFKNHPDYIDNLKEVINSIDVCFDIKSPKTFSINYNKPLREICFEKLNLFLKNKKNVKKESYIERLEKELKIIEEKKLEDFFLLAFDIANFLKSKSIAYGPARGSSASSLVLFLLEVTKIDPVKYDLLFERFLNPARIELPDIDMDICWKKRNLVFNYLFEKYKNRIGLLATIKRFFPYGLINELSKHFKISKEKMRTIKRFFPKRIHFSLIELLEKNEKLLMLYSTDNEIREFIDILIKIEGLPHHSSVHSGGIVITPGELNNFFSFEFSRSGETIIQVTKDDIEQTGFIKIDILGLRYVSIINETMRKLKLTKINLNDRKTFDLLSEADTIGVFQLESYGMRELLKNIKPDSINILSDVIALYRPGPLISGMTDEYCKRRKTNFKYEAKRELDQILKDTNGIFIYQEQILNLVTKIASFDWDKADKFRKALSDKKVDIIVSMKEDFIKGCNRNNISEDEAKRLFSIIVDFGSYSFNKAHSISYAYNAYLCAYLKAHYPFEYFISLLNNHIGFNSKLQRYIYEAKEKNIEFLKPDINRSHLFFKKEDGKIRCGLLIIKYLGLNHAKKIISERKNGDFKDLFDFCYRLRKEGINVRTIEYLIMAGCFDFCGISRQSLIEILPKITEKISKIYSEEEKGAIELFSIKEEMSIENFITYPTKKESDMDREQMEFKATDLHISQHPLLEKVKNLQLDKIEYLSNLKFAFVAGVVEKVKWNEKNGKRFASLIISDETGSIRAYIYENCLINFGVAISTGESYLFKGRVNNSCFFIDEIYNI